MTGSGGDARELLRELPIWDKDDFLLDDEAFRDPDVPAALVQRTSGTSNRPLEIERGQPELDFISEFFHEVDGQSRGPHPICITVSWLQHGNPVPVPYPGSVISFDLDDPGWDIELLLSTPWDAIRCEEGPAVLIGLESQIRRLTCRLIERGYDFSRSALTQLHTTGDLITSRLRRFYEGTWGVPLVDRYSMTEIFGGATECASCGFRHLDPYVLGEVVDPLDRTPIESGSGVLVLSCLYPFVQKQPIVRYFTGDLVELGPATCPSDSLAFRLLGRLAGSVVVPGPQVLLSAAGLYGCLDELPEVAASATFGSRDGLADPTTLGHLKLAVDVDAGGGCTRISVRVELRFSHYAHPEASAALCRRAHASIVERHPELRDALSAGTAELYVVPELPGALSPFMPDEAE